MIVTPDDGVIVTPDDGSGVAKSYAAVTFYHFNNSYYINL